MKKHVKNRKELTLSLIFNAGLVMAILLLCVPLSESGDDAVMMSIVSGGYGEYTSYIVFSNIFYAKIIMLLNSQIGLINWYMLIQFEVIFFSFCSITYILLRKYGIKLGFLLSFCFLMFFSSDVYMQYQFTKTAALATAAGCVVLFYIIRAGKSTLGIIIGGGLIILGSMIRFYSFLEVMGIFFPLGIWLILIALRKNEYDTVKRCVFIFGTVVIASFAFYFSDKMVYNSQSEWAEYKAYNSLRSKIRDYPIADYDENEEAYRAIGMTKNDYLNLLQWNIGDIDYYTPDLYKKIINIKPENKLERQEEAGNIREAIRFYTKEYGTSDWLACFIIVSILLLFFIKNRWEIIGAGMCSFFLIGVYSIYLYLQGRYGLQRIEMALWLSGILFMLSAIPSSVERTKYNRKMRFLGIGAYVAIAFLCFGNYRSNICAREEILYEKAKVRDFYDYLNANRENIYLMNAVSGYMGEQMSLFEPYELGYCDNVLGLGGWYTNSPIMKEAQKRQGIQNVFRDVVDNSHAFIISKNDIDIETEYIREHYFPNAYNELVETYGNYKIYSIKTAQ